MLDGLATAISDLSGSDRSQIEGVLRRLLRDGFLWRDDEQDRKDYGLALRHLPLVQDYLSIAGWQVVHHERLHIFHVMHAEGAHRRRFSKETTIWFILLRLIYAEQKEATTLSLTRHPVVTVAELYRRYVGFFPGKAVRKKTSLEEALKTFAGAKVIRPAGTHLLRVSDPEQLLELLPICELLLPAPKIGELVEQLNAFVPEQSAKKESSKADIRNQGATSAPLFVEDA